MAVSSHELIELETMVCIRCWERMLLRNCVTYNCRNTGDLKGWHHWVFDAPVQWKTGVQFWLTRSDTVTETRIVRAGSAPPPRYVF